MAKGITWEVPCEACDGRGQTGLEAWHGDCELCNGMGVLAACQSCSDAITGAIWPGGVCLDCHNRNAYPYPCEQCGATGPCGHP